MENKEQRTAERRKEVTQWETKDRAKKEGDNNGKQRTGERRKEVTQWKRKNRGKKGGGNTMGNNEESKEGRR